MTEKRAVLFVRSATDDEAGALSRKAQEEAGKEFARKNGLSIVSTWEHRGKSPLEHRRALRHFVGYIKASPSIQALLLERPERLSRRFGDWVELHGLFRHGEREIRFFGWNQSPESDATVLEMSHAFYRQACEARRKAKMRMEPSTGAA